jgi:hypothetical protein
LQQNRRWHPEKPVPRKTNRATKFRAAPDRRRTAPFPLCPQRCIGRNPAEAALFPPAGRSAFVPKNQKNQKPNPPKTKKTKKTKPGTAANPEIRRIPGATPCLPSRRHVTPLPSVRRNVTS